MDLSTSLPIMIHLETVVQQEGDSTQHIFDEPGQLVQVGRALYIRYKETSEDDGTQIPVTMKIEPDGDVKITRGEQNGNQS